MKTTAQEEGERLKKILIHEGIRPIHFANEIGLQRASVSKYIAGDLQIPSSVVKYLNKKYHMSFNWFYYGELPMKLIEAKKETLISTTTDLKLELEMTRKQLARYIKKTDQLIKDFYADKHSVLETHRGHKN